MFQYLSNAYQVTFNKKVFLGNFEKSPEDTMKNLSDSFKADKKLMLELIAIDRIAFQHAANELKENIQFVLEAIKCDDLVLTLISDDLKKNENFIFAATEQFGEGVFEYAAEILKKNRDFILKIIKKFPRVAQFAHADLQSDFSFIKDAIHENPKVILYVPITQEKLLSVIYKLATEVSEDARHFIQYITDKKIILSLLSNKGSFLKYVSADLKEDEEVVMNAVKQDASALQFAALCFQQKEAALKFVEQNYKVIEYFDADELKKDEKIIFRVAELLKDDATKLYELLKKIPSESEKIISSLTDKNVIQELLAKTKMGDFLKYVAEEFKQDEDIVLTAAQQNASAFQYAHQSLKENRDFLIKAVKKNPDVIMDLEKSCREDKDIMLEVAKGGPMLLLRTKSEFRKDKSFILEVAKKNGSVYFFAHEDLKKDEQIILAAVKQNGMVLECVPDELKKDKKIVVEALKQNVKAWQFIAIDKELREELLKDIEVQAIKINWEAPSFPGFYNSKISLSNKSENEKRYEKLNNVNDLFFKFK